MRKAFLAVFVCCTVAAVAQQVPSFKFGKISEADFSTKTYTIDTGAAAVVLADIGSTQIKGKDDWFALEFKHYKRVHILKKSGYDIATVEIYLYAEEELEEKLDDLKAVTYNLEDGKVVETKLNAKTQVFKDKLDKNRVVKKFTFPNIKEGSIIEYEYKITSDFMFNLQPWSFQGEAPVLWSQYTVSLPQFMNYILISQGIQQFYLRDQKDKMGSYSVEMKNDPRMGYASSSNQRINISCGVTDFRWVMKDVPAFQEEAFTSTWTNYISRLEFQLAGYRDPLIEQKIMTTWPDLVQRILKREDFGQQLENTWDWLPVMVEPLIAGAKTEKEKARKIYEYLRDNFTCTDHSQLFTEQPLKKIAVKKNGGVAEINLLMTAMLRQAGLKADPVLLSTRENGFVYEQYPVANHFNYVISRVRVDGVDILLDASRPGIGFGKLHYDCYNGQARVMNEEATAIALKPDDLAEKNVVTYAINTGENGKWTGQVSKLYGYYESIDIRRKLAVSGKEGLAKDLAGLYGNDMLISNLRVDSLGKTDEPLSIRYDITYNEEMADILYMNPVMVSRFKENPFKSAKRQYPVEMPYKMDEQYVLNLQIPEGYVVDEMPKPVTIKLNPYDDIVFEYKISQTGSTIMVRYKLEMKRAIFYPAEYNTLRDFFAVLVAKHNEQIVLKKKK
jgi:hypothetical protein